MKVCGVLHCGATDSRNPDLMYYGLPLGRERRKKWTEMIQLEKLGTYPVPHLLRVCSLHFPGGQKTAEHNDPSIFPWSDAWPTVIDNYINKLKTNCEISVEESSSLDVNTSHFPICLPEFEDPQDCQDEKSQKQMQPAKEEPKSEMFQLYFRSQHCEHWTEFHQNTPVLSCMTRYSGQVFRIQTSRIPVCGPSKFQITVSSATPNSADSSTMEEDNDDDDDKQDDDDDTHDPDPAALLASGKGAQLMKLLQKYRKEKGISSLSKKYQSFPDKRKQAPVCSDNEDREGENFQNHQTINIEGVTYRSVFDAFQEAHLTAYIMRETSNKAPLSLRDLRELVFEFCVRFNIARPPFWNVIKAADMDWLDGYLRRCKSIVREIISDKEYCSVMTSAQKKANSSKDKHVKPCSNKQTNQKKNNCDKSHNKKATKVSKENTDKPGDDNTKCNKDNNDQSCGNENSLKRKENKAMLSDSAYNNRKKLCPDEAFTSDHTYALVLPSEVLTRDHPYSAIPND